MAITIKTRLHESIYKSHGGGQTHVEAEYATGPRNLIKAIAELKEIRASNCRGYGNIGCGYSWLEIDGVALTKWHEEEMSKNLIEHEMYSYRAGDLHRKPETLTERARDLISRAQAGKIPGEYNLDDVDF